MRSRSRSLGMVAWLVTASALAMGCAQSHSLGDDGGGVDQSFVFDGDVADQGFVDGSLMDGGRVDLGPDAGRTCESVVLRPADPGLPGAPIIFPPESECRTSAECTGDTQCFGASDPVCGICPLPMRDCENDGDCGTNEWCRAGQPTCCGGVDTTCEADCGPSGVACPDGEVCDEDTGHCERNSCLSLDFACPENHDCDPERPDADVTGCARRECNADAECDCGFCVTGTCESALGVCMFPPA